MPGEVCFSPAAIALLAAVLAPFLTAFGIVYRDGIKSRDNQITYLTLELTEANDRLRHGAKVMDEAETVVRERSDTRRRRI